MPQEMPTVFEAASLVAVVAVLLVDLVVIGRRPHVPSVRESVTWVLVYVGLALGFAALLAWLGGPAPAGHADPWRAKLLSVVDTATASATTRTS